MLFKHLSFIKQFEEKNLKDLLENSFEFYLNKETEIKSEFLEDEKSKCGFSNLVRFFRGINSTKKPTEEQITSNLKEIFKGKSADLANIMMDLINKIIQLQSKNLNFSEIKLTEKQDFEVKKRDFILSSFSNFVNFDWRVNIKVSNNFSNRILLPEILFNFTLTDGKVYSFVIEYRVFQELRKLLTLHLKRIMENENVILLRNI